jgi:hypothetical protein
MMRMREDVWCVYLLPITRLFDTEFHGRGTARGNAGRLNVVTRELRAAFRIDVVEDLPDHVKRAGEVRTRIADKQASALPDASWLVHVLSRPKTDCAGTTVSSTCVAWAGREAWTSVCGRHNQP